MERTFLEFFRPFLIFRFGNPSGCRLTKISPQSRIEPPNEMELSSFEETIPNKLERVIQNQELLLEQLQAMSREPVKSIEEAVDKTLAKVNSSQLDTIEKVNNVQSQVDKITGNQSRLASGLNELKTEITNRTFLQNELSKDLDELSLFVKSGEHDLV